MQAGRHPSRHCEEAVRGEGGAANGHDKDSDASIDKSRTLQTKRRDTAGGAAAAGWAAHVGAAPARIQPCECQLKGDEGGRGPLGSLEGEGAPCHLRARNEQCNRKHMEKTDGA